LSRATAKAASKPDRPASANADGVTYVERSFDDPEHDAEVMAARIEASLRAAGIGHDVFLRPLHDTELHESALGVYRQLLGAGVYQLRRTRLPFEAGTGEPLVEARCRASARIASRR
jgi:hypothetical protein